MFVPGKPFYPNLFWGVMPGAYPSGAPEKCFTQVSSGFTHKHYDKLEKLSRDKHTSLLPEFVNNGSKKLCNNGPWSKGYKTFYGRNSQICNKLECLSAVKRSTIHIHSTPEKAPGLTHKHYTRPERLAGDKHFSSLLTFVNYGCKKLYNIGPW